MRARPLTRLPSLIGVGLLFATSLVVLVSTRAEAVRYGEPNRFCLYQHTDFHSGNLGPVCLSESQLNDGENLADHGFDDQASSIVNNLGRLVCFYTGANSSGDYGYLGAYSFWRNLTNNKAPGGTTWNDRISSLRTC